MAATLFSTSLSPSFLSLSSASKPTAPSSLAASLPSKLPPRALSAEARRPFLAAAVAMPSEFGTDAAEDEDGEAPAEYPEDLKLFVGNLPFSVDSAKLAALFEQSGNVEMVEVIYDKMTGRSRGFGFVTMSTVEEAGTAVEQFNGYELEGRALRVNAGPPPPRDESQPRGYRGGGGGSFDSGNRLYVGNLSWGVDNSALENLFSVHGRVVEARVIYDRETGRSRGFGFVTYDSGEEVSNAIRHLDGADLDGRQIRVTVAESRPRRQF